MSLDVFGFALQRSVLDEAGLHQLVGSALARQFPDCFDDYPAWRLEAESEARTASASQPCPALAISRISDHLEQVLQQVPRPTPACVIARSAIDLELELEQIIARADPDARRLYDHARDRGVTVAMITDSHLPRDLIARMLSDADLSPDHLLVASNEGVTKESGLFERLLSVTGEEPGQIEHYGSNHQCDVEQPGRLGLRGILVTQEAGSTKELFALGLTSRSGIDSIALALADRRFRRGGPVHSRARDIGYYAGGPLAVGFASWIGQQIDEQHPDQVLFCGPGGDLLRRVTAILRPNLGANLLTAVPPAGPDRGFFDHLDALGDTLRVHDGASVLVVETGLDGECEAYVEEWASRSGRAVEVTGAYFGLRAGAENGGVAWAFDGTPSCEIEQHVNRRPEILEALLRSFPPSAKELPRSLRPFVATGREMEAGVIDFAEDFQPWARLDDREMTPALAEPALRVISNPTPAEALALGGYPAWTSCEGERPVPLAAVPRRLRIVPKPRHAKSRAADARWLEGARALHDHRHTSTPNGRAAKRP